MQPYCKHGNPFAPQCCSQPVDGVIFGVRRQVRAKFYYRRTVPRTTHGDAATGAGAGAGIGAGAGASQGLHVSDSVTSPCTCKLYGGGRELGLVVRPHTPRAWSLALLYEYSNFSDINGVSFDGFCASVTRRYKEARLARPDGACQAWCDCAVVVRTLLALAHAHHHDVVQNATHC